MSTENKSYATLQSPLIEAAVGGYYSFRDLEAARRRLDQLRNHFIVSKEQENGAPKEPASAPEGSSSEDTSEADASEAVAAEDAPTEEVPQDDPAPPCSMEDGAAHEEGSGEVAEGEALPASVRLWIRGFDLSEEEREKGGRGNFAYIRCVPKDEGKYTLRVEKDPVSVRKHPERNRPKRSHPDWGHPLMRPVKNKTIFDNIDEPREILEKLHEIFPNVSIPLGNKMYVILYSKTYGKKNPTRKFVLEIKIADQEEGKFYIEARENDYERKGPPVKRSKTPDEEAKEGKDGDEEVQGYFTSLVALKRKPKK